jgi:hypothetical protein
VRQDRAFQAIRIRTLNNPLVKLPVELKTKIFQTVFSDVSIVLCRRRGQLTVLTSNLTSIPPMLLSQRISTMTHEPGSRRGLVLIFPTCCRYDGRGRKSGAYSPAMAMEGSTRRVGVRRSRGCPVYKPAGKSLGACGISSVRMM